MMDQDRTAFLTHATAAVEANDPQAVRRACKKLLVLCWMHLTAGDRWSFWDRTGPNTLEFVPPEPDEDVPPSDLAYILRRWHEILPRIHDRKSRAFADDVNRRRKFKSWVPTERQTDWIRRLWKDFGTEEPVVDVLEEVEG